MNPGKFIIPISPPYQKYLSFAFWGVAAFFLMHHTPYGLDEGAAKSLILIWSVADQVASTAVTLSPPDLRILLLSPVGFLWTGNIFAAKVLTAALLAFAANLFYSWKRDVDEESALVATGLLLISPLSISQVDSIGISSYLLLAFALGNRLNIAYRITPRPFSGLYFAQLLLCAISTSLHPAGLALPLALIWSWHKDPLDSKQQKYFLIGTGFVTIFTLLVRMGWSDLTWLQNPVKSLSAILLSPPLDGEMLTANWIAGGICLLVLTIVLAQQFRNILSDFLGRTLLVGLALGAFCGDSSWSMLALCLILYYGFPLLVRRQPNPIGGLIQQRGLSLLVLVIISTLFMRADKLHYEIIQQNILSGQDELIQTLANETEQLRRIAEERDIKVPQINVASQWPSRTMIACRCNTFPLPPATKDSQTQLAQLKSITYLILAPKDPSNIMLARNLASLGGDSAETVALLPQGVLVRLKKPNSPP